MCQRRAPEPSSGVGTFSWPQVGTSTWPLTSWIAEIARTAGRSPGEAFGELVALTSFFNAAVGLRSSIAEKIRKHVDEVRKALATIAEGLEADSFSMSASLPVGLSVSLTFKVKPGE